MIKKEVTQTAQGEYGIKLHLKTVYKIFGITVYVIKTETLN